MQEYTSALIIHKQNAPFFSLSLYLNDIKPIQSLEIENESETDVAQIEIKITADQPCIEPFHYTVLLIPAKKEVKIPLENLKVNRNFLTQLSETEKANITIKVIEKDIVVITETIPIDIHPIEQFGGFQTFPELIAAYITPNHPYIYHIKRKAIKILESQGLETQFEGYQRNDPERVLQIISAIYSAIQSEEIVYSSLPPDYEKTGQRLRLLNTIQQEKFANGIDLSLLLAACLEAVHLNPILIIVSGHAFVGCWLHDDKFPEVINDDKTAITKRLSKGIHEIVAVEATTICKGSDIKFSDALDAGEAQLVQKETFLLSVDIKRARTLRIHPLPLLTHIAEKQLDEETDRQTGTAEMEDCFEIGTIYHDELLHDSRPKTKQKIWERKLLDLSLRNNLLNLRMTRNMLQLVDLDITYLENTLSEGKSFSIMPNSEAEVLGKYNLFTQPLHHSSSLYKMANDELKHNRLLTHYHQQDLDNILSHIHKNAKQAIEENGSSTLYLAVGLLKWFDRKTPDHPHYSPVLLVPVEINRRSVNSKFTLKSREEETMINITLVEFLRQEYELNLSALEQLPYDEKGVDVAKVMGVLRRAVISLKGWNIEEQVVLGNFSFNKLILWKDLVVHQEKLQKSDMVRSLIEGKLTFNENLETLSASDFDKIHSQSLILPIPTDVSQMEAILMAQQGRSFILHGPPGTGKSQTITNIIADALYHGKRVLFVAAKKAALDVVHKRLDQIGLAPFTLELHSNKSKKSDVLEQLARSLETVKSTRIADFTAEAKRLDTAKKAISDYVNILHKRQQVGWSLYDTITALENYSDKNFPKKFISKTILQQLDTTLWQQWVDWLPQFQSIIGLIVHPAENPLTALNFSHYSLSINDEISTQTQKMLQLLSDLQTQNQSLITAIHFPFSVQSKKEWQQFVQMINILQNLPDISLDLIRYLSNNKNYKVYEEWHQAFHQYLTVINRILKDYKRNILELDITRIEMQWKLAQQNWFLPQWLQKRKIKKQLSLFRNTPFTKEEEIEELFSDNDRLQKAQHLLGRNRFFVIEQMLNDLYKEEQTDLQDIDNKARLIQSLSRIANIWGHGSLTQWIRILKEEKKMQDSNDFTQPNSALIQEYIQFTANFNKQKESYETLTGIDFKQNENWLPETITQLKNIQAHLPQLKNWMNYVQLRNQGETLLLKWLIEAFESKFYNIENVVDYFHYTVHSSIAKQVITQHKSLSLFNANLFESKIEQYRKIAKNFQYLTIQELRVQLGLQLPNTTVEAMQSSEIGILQRAIKNRGRGLSIRKLFDQIPALLPRIAPCMLMSPISVAQYFDIDAQHFDIVIFDEASQLPTCEAVSALARAKQSVIVGDPKQMPPTSFFSAMKLDEENMEVEDLESILDDCLSLSMPSKYLLRHYRSKHESLIAFSNVNFYDNQLLTFPSADDLNRKVKYHHVKGFYDKGKTRTNKFEADKIVQHIKSHYSDPQKRKLSLGVVTFNQAQQNLIEEKLQKLFISAPELEEFTANNSEPLFIKNLENVQGDERDIILFSVCYAPDQQGKMSMNLGPLNRGGGWRRLNVAITRSRYEMHIYATLQADQIDLSRTSAEGVAGLRAFLRFAEKGYLSVHSEHFQEKDNKKHLSEYVSKQLQKRGLRVKCNIGSSNFKVDIAIVHPENPQRYILGIVIDGYYYYNAHTSNDREMVIPSMLKLLGWNIHRIWSIDWYENAETIVEKIMEKVKNLQAELEIREEDTKEPPAVIPSFKPIKATPKASVAVAISKQKPYLKHTPTPIPNAHSEMIHNFKNRNLIKKQIQTIVEKEAPISKNLLYKKVMLAWNASHAGARLDKYLKEVIEELNLTQTVHHQTFYWKDKNTTLNYYRSNDVEKHNLEDIAPEEILVALQEVIANNLSIEENELLRYLARTFGVGKVGKQADSLLRHVVDMAENKGIVKRGNGRVKWNDK